MLSLTMFIAICVLLSTQLFIDNSEAAVQVFNTKFKDGGQFFCPKRSFVSNFIIYKGEKQGGVYKDFRFYFECDLFPTDPDFNDNSTELCTTRFKWTMGGYDLKMDDHWKSCSCDEYLAGVSTEWTGSERVVQFRCCYAVNKIHNITGCYFTGQRPLQADWNTEIRAKKGRPVTEGIQTFAIIGEYVIGRVCPYLVKGIDIDDIGYMTNKCSGVKQRSFKDIMDEIQSMIKDCTIWLSSPFGWVESQNSLSSDQNMADRDSRLYKKQNTMCKDGWYLYAIYKFPKVGPKGKDYVFLTRCHVLVYTVCYCFWKQNCTKPEKRNTSETNKTMYVAGWRSEWDETNSRRKFEMWCCKSDGLTMHFCNLTKNYTDADTSLVIARPRYKFFAFYEPKAIDGQIIRDVDHWYKNGILQLRFNICNINGSDGDCTKPCKRCQDIDPTGAICRPPVVVVVVPIINITSTTTAATTTCYMPPTGGGCQPPPPPQQMAAPMFARAFAAQARPNAAALAVPQTTPPPPCKMDVNFVLDSTGSLTQSGFNQEVQFIQTFTSQLTISPTDSRVGLTEFGHTAMQIFDFNSPQTQSYVQGQLSNLPYYASDTNITGALQTSLSKFTSPRPIPGTNTCRPRVDILITDGRQNVGTIPPAFPAAALRNMGVTLYAIGIGPDANQADLTSITGNANNVKMVDYSTLQQTVSWLLQAACAQQSGSCTNTYPPQPINSDPSGGSNGSDGSKKRK